MSYKRFTVFFEPEAYDPDYFWISVLEENGQCCISLDGVSMFFPNIDEMETFVSRLSEKIKAVK
jgi:hypothetical protein